MKSVRQAIVKTRKYSKVITADAGQHIALTQAGFQPLGNRDQQFVAGHGPQRFIHPAETAEIDGDDAELRCIGPGAIGQPIVDFLAKTGAVGQRGQAVGQQLTPQILFDRPFAGPVDRGEEIMFGTPLRGWQPAERTHKIFRPELAVAAQFETFRIAARLNEANDPFPPFLRDPFLNIATFWTGAKHGDEAGIALLEMYFAVFVRKNRCKLRQGSQPFRNMDGAVRMRVITPHEGRAAGLRDRQIMH